MRAVALALSCLFAAGCYDLGALSRSFDAAPGGDAATDGGVRAGDGGNWYVVGSPTRDALRGVFGTGGGDVYAAGASSAIVRITAHPPAFEAAPPGYALRAVWAGGAGALAVGDSQTVLTRGSAGWDGASLGDATLYAVAGLPGGDAFAVGSGGLIEHRTTIWSVEDSGVVVALRGVWARAAGDVLAVGDAGTIVHGTGVPLTWAPEASGVTADLSAVWANAADAWAVGAGGLVLHATAGGVWSVESSSTSADLFGVFGAGDLVWAVGAGGTILIRVGGIWTIESQGGANLRAVWAADGEAWAVGDGGTILHRVP